MRRRGEETEPGDARVPFRVSYEWPRDEDEDRARRGRRNAHAALTRVERV